MWTNRANEISDRPALAKTIWWSAVVLISFLHLFINALNIGTPELWLDESSTFGVATHSISRLLTLPTEFHSQPPLYYILLHFILKVCDARWFIRGFSWLACFFLLQFVLFFVEELSLAARMLFCLLFILSDLTRYLSTALRPYGLTALLTFVSSILFLRMMRDPTRRRAVAYGLSAFAMLYTLAFDVWVAVAHGCCLLALLVWHSWKGGFRATLRRYRPPVIAMFACGISYLPYLCLAIHWQYKKNQQQAIQELWNLHHYWDAIPEYFGFAPAVLFILCGLMVLGVLSEVRARRPMVLMWLVLAFGQVAFVVVFMTGRNWLGPAVRYLTPAFPALCFLAALGFQELTSRNEKALWQIAPLALALLAGPRFRAFEDYLRAPRPIGAWEKLHREMAQRGGRAVVFFNVGYAGQDFEYVIRKDPNVVTATMRGRGMASGGDNHLDPEYIRKTIEATRASTQCYYYWGGTEDGPFGKVFRPAMLRLGYSEVAASNSVRGYCRAVTKR